ncbi:MAG: hypothetical protein PHW18_06295 [Sulfuricurvum sp.]|uniref:hypothetical protein n=1 Tax=Sulfuricurvum sp. TaxID=2025608 RepID=UPI0026320077|nr:hypothetical protein [Sulfuricurvum sp.]MDD2829166.1 hypothetical protein [Sulfuricurvum sp.]MDD4950215.1 hypothetical protein [Sulfuricurvum sp.]
MNDEKLKLILAGLGGLIFSLIFILLAFVLPLKDTSVNQELQAKHTLEKISQGIKDGKFRPPPDEKGTSQEPKEKE